MLLFFSLFFTLNSQPARPTWFVAVNSSGRHKDIQLFHTRRGAQKFLTRTPEEETALLCRGKRVIYVAGQNILTLETDKNRENTIGALPQDFVAAMTGQIRHFLRLSPDGSRLAYPGTADLQVRGVGDAFQKTIAPEPGTRIVHPAFWNPAGDELAYLTQNQEGTVWLHLQPLNRVDPRVSLVAVSASKGTVSAVDMHHSGDGKIAVNLDMQQASRKNARYFLVADTDTGKLHTLSPSWKLEKFHGWSSGNELVFSGRVQDRMGLYYWNPANPKTPHRVEPLLKREVYGYYPAMDITVMYTAGQKCADRPRLLATNRNGQDRRLLRWAEWAEVIALDSARTWGLFRAGGNCADTRPALYLMKMDGSGLLDEMPRKSFSLLHSLHPEQLAICD